jgi:DMSO reductase family type II enzyme heme b subunit
VKQSKLMKLLIVAFTLGMFAVANAADIKAVKINGPIPTQPDDPFWSERYGPTSLKHVIVDMDPQMITNPMWPNPSTKYVFVKAATNGKEIAVHLEYNDPTRNDIMVQSQQYKDQAAIMFPVNQSG